MLCRKHHLMQAAILTAVIIKVGLNMNTKDFHLR